MCESEELKVIEIGQENKVDSNKISHDLTEY